MKRAQIQIDDEVYELLRSRALEEKKSIARIIQEILKKDISQSDRHRSFSIKDFTFIGAGRSRQGSLKPVSERHDQALEEVFNK
jgi:hypothetical protein